MFGALNYLQLAAGTIAGAVLMALVGFVYMHAVAIPAAKVEAVAAATHKAEVAAEKQRQTQQDKIDAIEKQYLQYDANHAARVQSLQEALDAARASRNPACRYAIPRGVSDRLDDIGRAAPGAHSAKPSSGVP